MDQNVTQLVNALMANASEELADPMEAYMRGKFKYLGLKAPLRKEVLKENFNKKAISDKSHLKKILVSLWDSPYRECQYCAVEIARSNIKLFNEDDIEFFEGLITSRSWWDTVDHIAPNIIGSILAKLPKEKRWLYSESWILSDNLWLQRTSIIFQLFYKKNTDFALLTNNILATLETKDFFIRKAAGWALCQYTRTNKNDVVHFVEEYQDVLSALTIKEALKLLEGK